MALVSVVRAYNFSKGELDGSRWMSLDESAPAKEIRLSGSLELLSPKLVTVCTSFKDKTEDYRSFLNTFRWTLGLESSPEFRWPDYLADEAINVQLIFDIYDRSLSVYEAYGALESLLPTRPIPESAGRRFGMNLLKVLGTLAKESTIPIIKTAGPALSELALNSIPSSDSKNETLWYLHRFHYQQPREQYSTRSQYRAWAGHGSANHCRSFGVEWRITNRLIRTVGSRLAGVVGVLFFQAPEPNVQVQQHDPPIRARSLFGLKPKFKQADWLHFTWRPAAHPRDYKRWNKLKDRRINSQPVTIDLGIHSPALPPDPGLSTLSVEP